MHAKILLTVYTKFWSWAPHAYLAWFWYWLSHTSVLNRLIVIYWETRTVNIKRFRIWICKVTVDLLNIHFLCFHMQYNFCLPLWVLIFYKHVYGFVIENLLSFCPDFLLTIVLSAIFWFTTSGFPLVCSVFKVILNFFCKIPTHNFIKSTTVYLIIV